MEFKFSILLVDLLTVFCQIFSHLQKQVKSFCRDPQELKSEAEITFSCFVFLSKEGQCWASGELSRMQRSKLKI